MHNTTSALTQCGVLQKTEERIARKFQDRRIDKLYSYDSSGHGRGSSKRTSQFRDIAVYNKNKIQYNSAYYSSIT